MSNLELLSRNDGYDGCRNRESARLRSKIRNRFEQIQNPSDCNRTKILKCYPYTNPEGWGEFFSGTLSKTEFDDFEFQ